MVSEVRHELVVQDGMSRNHIGGGGGEPQLGPKNGGRPHWQVDVFDWAGGGEGGGEGKVLPF